MKHLLIILIEVLILNFNLGTLNCSAQNVGINNTGATPNSSAILDLNTGNTFTAGAGKGLLIPRMATADRPTGTVPEGLLIYNTDSHCIEAYYNGTWIAFGCIGCLLPGSFSATAATNVNPTSFSANWTVSPGATNYYLDVATDAGFTAFVSGYNNLNVSNVSSYTVTGTALSCGNTFYYRVRASNSCGTIPNSNTITITIPSCCGGPPTSSTCGGSTLYDSRDGQTYNIVTIGTQCWMAQNLNYGTYVANHYPTGQLAGEKYCYGNTSANCNTYGGLYDWTNMMHGAPGCNGGGASCPPCCTPEQGICPSGWHVPSHYEWTLLEQNICTSSTCATDFPYVNGPPFNGCGTDEGSFLKENGTSHWTGNICNPPVSGSCNSSGFTALPGGDAISSSFSNLNSSGYWWTATEYTSGQAWFRQLSSSSTQVSRSEYFEYIQLSVRCVKD